MKLASSPWPRFRADMASSGRSTFPGPLDDEIVWELSIGKISGEPAVGIDGTIYFPLKSEELVAISANGEELWRKPLIGHRDKPLRGITTPAIRSDGSLIVAAMRKVVCLEPDGKQRWEKLIDGLPAAPNIGPQGTIYVSAWSIDWAGIYVISPEGESTGLDDPQFKKRWMGGRFNTVSPVAIDKEGNVYAPFRDNVTHPEAYTWDPIDEVDEDYQYQCVVFNSEGKKLGRFDPYTRSFPYPTTVSVSKEGWAYYIHASWPALDCFTLNDILTDKNKYNKKTQWTWDKYRDKDEDGTEGPSYNHKPYGYVTLGDNQKVWFRTSKNLKPRKIVIQIDASMVKKQDILDFEVLEVSATVDADPVIDCNGLVYIGAANGKIHIYNSKGKKVRIINIKHPIQTIAIGPEASLIVATKNKKLFLIR